MRKALAICLMALLACFATRSQEAPRIEWEHTTIDMGTIKAADGKVEYEFPFTNAGEKPLVIMTAFASCDCTSPTYPTAPIAPGEKGVIKVKYDPRKKAGEVTATITVISNDPARKRSALRLEGVVVPKKSWF